MAIVEATDGKWFAVSPANIRLYKQNYQNVITADSLEQLLEKIEDSEGGSWRMSQDELSHMRTSDNLPEFYELRLRKLSDMRDTDFMAAISAYNETIDTDKSKITAEQIHRLKEKMKKL